MVCRKLRRERFVFVVVFLRQNLRCWIECLIHLLIEESKEIKSPKFMLINLYLINPKSDQHQISPHNMNT